MSTFDPKHVDVEHFLDTLGIENITRATQQEMRFSCPFPNHDGGDETPSCYMNQNTSAFFCHGCKEKGSAVDFAAYVLQISPIAATRLLKSAYQPGAINPDARHMVDEVQKILAGQTVKIEQPILDPTWLNNYGMDWRAAYEAWLANNGTSFEPADYFFGRGFEPETLEFWKFGWDDTSGRIVFPIFDLDGNLIGLKGRAHWPGAKPKYLVLGDGPSGGRYGYPRYYPSMVVFGAHLYRDGVESLIVCEGELNAIATTMKTGLPAVAINGSFFSEWHAKIIRRITSSAILFFDEDQAGEHCTWGWYNARGEYQPGVVDLLDPHMPVRIAGSHEKDAAELDGLAIKDICITKSRSSLLARIGRS
jgi:CHC2 zinc finger/DNA primase catalytic core, N-terminal domain